MPISGVYSYSVDASTVITSALEDIQVVQNGETINNDDLTVSLRELNLMTKAWMGKPGFAPGLKRWTRKVGYLFLRKNKNIYSLGPIASGGDYCCTTNYTQGTLTAAAAQSATSISVSAMYASPTYTTATTPANTDYIGIVLDSGDIHWTTVSGSPTLPGTITLSVGLTGPASSGNYVFSFATSGQTVLPLDVLTWRRRDINAIDYEGTKMQDIFEYEAITNKNIVSTPVQWFYQMGLSVGQLMINCMPATITDVFRMQLLYPIDDESTTASTMAFPQQWYSALAKGLGKRLAPKFGKAWTDTMEANFQEAMADASMVDPDQTSMFFQPNS
jgi:hypothetical protein